MQHYIYTHKRNDTSRVFYVGKGSGRRAWVTQHRNPYWKAVVAKAGGYEVDIVIDHLDEELSLLVEMEMIAKYKRLGVKLTNLTDGGEGMSGYKAAPEVIARRAEAQRGQARPTVSQKLKGVPKSEDHKRKLAESRLGTKASEETKRKMSKTRKGRVGTMLGKTHSEESKRKTSAAVLALPRKTCPHCGKSNLDPGNAARLHFDRCKEKK